MAGDSDQRLEEQGQPSGSEPFLIGVSGGTASGKVSGGARGERSGGHMAAWRGRAAAAPRALPGNRGNRGRANRNRSRAGSLPRCPSTARCRLGKDEPAEGAEPPRPLRGRRLRELRGHVEGGAQALSPSRPGPGSSPPLRGEQGQDGAGIPVQNPPVASTSASPPPPCPLRCPQGLLAPRQTRSVRWVRRNYLITFMHILIISVVHGGGMPFSGQL